MVIDFGCWWGLSICFHSEKLILAISVSFPEVRIRKEAEIGQRVQQCTRFDVDDGDEDDEIQQLCDR